MSSRISGAGTGCRGPCCSEIGTLFLENKDVETFLSAHGAVSKCISFVIRPETARLSR